MLRRPAGRAERTDTWLRAATNPGGAGQHALLVNGPGEDAKSVSASGSISFRYEAVPSCGYGPAPPDQTFGTGPAGPATSRSWWQPDAAGASKEDAPWITLSRSDGVGTQNVQLTVAPNPDPQTRRASISVTGGSFDVVQGGAGCGYAIQAGYSNVWPSTPSTGAVRHHHGYELSLERRRLDAVGDVPPGPGRGPDGPALRRRGERRASASLHLHGRRASLYGSPGRHERAHAANHPHW